MRLPKALIKNGGSIMAEATNRLQNFQQFLQKLMGNEYSNQMVEQLIKLNPYEGKQIKVFQNWSSSSKDDQYDFMIWLVGAINSLYKSNRYTIGYKLSVVNATEKKAILNEVKLIVREEAQAMV